MQDLNYSWSDNYSIKYAIRDALQYGWTQEEIINLCKAGGMKKNACEEIIREDIVRAIRWNMNLNFSPESTLQR